MTQLPRTYQGLLQLGKSLEKDLVGHQVATDRVKEMFALGSWAEEE